MASAFLYSRKDLMMTKNFFTNLWEWHIIFITACWSGGMADAEDLKSSVLWTCGFESRLQHHKGTETLIQGFSPFLYVLAES